MSTDQAQKQTPDNDPNAIDELTGLRKYITFISDFDYAKFEGEDVYVIICDLDDFGLLNDRLGESRCDELLAKIAQAISRSFGAKHVWRFGGDEFIIANSFYDEEALHDKIDRLNRILANYAVDDKPIDLTASYGYTFGRIESYDDLHEAVRFADHNMFEAKRLGKNRIVSESLADITNISSDAHGAVHKTYEIDEITGLLNHVAFRSQVEQMLEQQRGSDVADDDRIALVYFNVQNFKHHNEKFGFEAGNDLLRLIADAISDVEPDRPAARFSADQFMLATTAGRADACFSRVRRAFREKFKDTSIWLRAGIYIPSDDDDDIGLNMDRPKIACDSIKGRRDAFCAYYNEDLKKQILAHRYTLENLDRAIDEGWIQVFYQPIVRVATGEVCDVEALARWVDPKRGIISPADFIPVLEDARLIHRLDLTILRRVCEDYKRITSEGKEFVPPSINLSRLDFELSDDIVQDVIDICDEFDVPHDFISVEVTESVLTGGQEFLKKEIDRFRENGFEVWMDDFGSGYSSLNLLKEFEFDLVKIDMEFLKGFETNELTRVILSSVISMAKELGLKTLVEGVETEEQYQFLRSIGCGRAQGWHFGKPTSYAGTMEAIVENKYPPIEPTGMHEFYEHVGHMNLMRPNPTMPIDGHYVPGDVPSVIVQRIKGVYSFLNVSDTYRSFLQSMGVASVEESERLMNSDRADYDRLRHSIDAAVASGDWEYTNYDDLGQHCALMTKCIANCPEEDAIAVIVMTVGTYGLLDPATL